ncbi:hypothetical protein [Bradyrhizobium sp. McL0615]|uniref:hypothetical protein n=1 Tax=Bradyrhizobium sp. McL0615 TaxID=3415673 RepID=UPI003CF7DC42
MFNRKTLFIVGAGAGFDIDIPAGRALAEDIARRTTIKLDHGYVGAGTADRDLALNFFEMIQRATSTLRHFVSFATACCSQIPLTTS